MVDFVVNICEFDAVVWYVGSNVEDDVDNSVFNVMVGICVVDDIGNWVFGECSVVDAVINSSVVDAVVKCSDFDVGIWVLAAGIVIGNLVIIIGNCVAEIGIWVLFVCNCVVDAVGIFVFNVCIWILVWRCIPEVIGNLEAIVVHSDDVVVSIWVLVGICIVDVTGISVVDISICTVCIDVGIWEFVGSCIVDVIGNSGVIVICAINAAGVDFVVNIGIWTFVVRNCVEEAIGIFAVKVVIGVIDVGNWGLVGSSVVGVVVNSCVVDAVVKCSDNDVGIWVLAIGCWIVEVSGNVMVFIVGNCVVNADM